MQLPDFFWNKSSSLLFAGEIIHMEGIFPVHHEINTESTQKTDWVKMAGKWGSKVESVCR
jgi:hypothetical protein